MVVGPTLELGGRQGMEPCVPSSGSRAKLAAGPPAPLRVSHRLCPTFSSDALWEGACGASLSFL